MKIETLLLCEKVGYQNGRMNITGIIDRLPADSVPGALDDFCVFMKIRWYGGDFGKTHRIQLSIIDYDGAPVVNPPLTACEFTQAKRYSTVIFPLRDVVIRDYGEYQLDLFIDGLPMASMFFSVRALR